MIAHTSPIMPCTITNLLVQLQPVLKGSTPPPIFDQQLAILTANTALHAAVANLMESLPPIYQDDAYRRSH